MIVELKILITIIVFFMTIMIIFIRPKGLNEAYPAAIGAIILVIAGVVTYSNLLEIGQKIVGASITIIATIVMAVILESFGFFHWVASKLLGLTKGSGYRLYWYIQLLCFFMTLLFNNDGSILITTPILILLLRNMHLKPYQQIPYLLSGALIATGSSAPIGVSNIVNLISLNIVQMSLYRYTEMMFIPGTIGLLFMSVLMFLVLKRKLPRQLPMAEIDADRMPLIKHHHPPMHPAAHRLVHPPSHKLMHPPSHPHVSPLKETPSLKEMLSFDTEQKQTSFMFKILAFVFGIRCLLFVASYFRIPIEIVAVLGSVVLLIVRWYYLRISPKDVVKKVPWHILVFAFSMYVIIFGLQNIGLTDFLIRICNPIVSQGLFNASFVMGGLTSVLSNIFNNHPALMIGTITLTQMGLDPITLKTIYLANIIGSDMGSLLLPIGTLASLIWMDILRKNRIKVLWRDYIQVTIIVIPLTVLFTLYLLYFWIQTLFA